MVRPMDVYNVLHKRPFVPFRIVTKTGKIYDIKERDRENVGAGTIYVFIGIRTNENDDIFDRHTRVFYENIDRLEILDARPMPASAN